MKDSELLDILDDAGGFVSGEKISRSAGVSRTAVWKAVRKLNERGHIIESSSSHGYRLVHRDDSSTAFPFIKYTNICSSTNDLARSGALRGDPEGTVYMSDIQTHGRGRMGKTWLDDPGRSLIMSILLRPMTDPSAAMSLSLMTGLAVCKAVGEICGIQCNIKWPNDIILNKRKIGGILIESALSGELLQYAVAGIGINLNNTALPPEISDIASSVYMESGIFFPRIRLAVMINDILLASYKNWLSEPAFLDEYRKLCITIGSQVILESNNSRLEAFAEDVDTDGSLVIRSAEGNRTRVISGEVSVRGIAGYV